MRPTASISMGLQGRLKVSIVENGITVHERDWEKNLILDRGLDILSEKMICQMFEVAGKGMGAAAPTKEVVPTSNTYTQAATTVTKSAGARLFTDADVGKMIKFLTSPAKYAMITDRLSDVQVSVDRTNTGVTNAHIELHSVSNDWTTIEEAFTTISGDILADKPMANNTVTADGPIFVDTDVGRAIHFTDSKAAFRILTFVDSQNVTVDLTDDVAIEAEPFAVYDTVPDELAPKSRTSTYSANSGENSTKTPASPGNERTFLRTFVFPAEPTTEILGGVASQAGTAVTWVSGRQFALTDVGMILRYADGFEAKITAVTVPNATVDKSVTKAATQTSLYGFTAYTEIFLSDEMFPGNNMNVHVPLASPINVYGATPGRPSQQLKVSYELKLTVTPLNEVAQDLNGIIVDTGNEMSANKNGKYAIESLATSMVDLNGETTSDFVLLEPSVPGDMGFGPSTKALDPFGGTDRSAGTFSTPLEADVYVPGSFTNIYFGTFGLVDAVAIGLRSLMLFDVDSGVGVFTFLFNQPQTKDGNHSLTIAFRKSWNRVI